jgi:T-complex protein 1 subunit zeta
LRETGVKSGLRGLKDAIETGKMLPGAGACEIGVCQGLKRDAGKIGAGKARFGVEAFAEGILSIPRALMNNSGFDAGVKIAEMQKVWDEGEFWGIDLETGEVIDPAVFGIWDSYKVVRGLVQSAPIVASQLLLVDEIIESGRVKHDL